MSKHEFPALQEQTADTQLDVLKQKALSLGASEVAIIASQGIINMDLRQLSYTVEHTDFRRAILPVNNNE